MFTRGSAAKTHTLTLNKLSTNNPSAAAKMNKSDPAVCLNSFINNKPSEQNSHNAAVARLYSGVMVRSQQHRFYKLVRFWFSKCPLLSVLKFLYVSLLLFLNTKNIYFLYMDKLFTTQTHLINFLMKRSEVIPAGQPFSPGIFS